MKKIFILPIVLLLVALVSGCGNNITGDVVKDFVCEKPIMKVPINLR